MKNKKLFIGVFIASIFAAFFGGKAFAAAGNTAEISGGKTWNICVEAGAGHNEAFVVNIEKSDFQSQLVLGGGDCKAVALAAGTYAARLSNVMGAGAASYEITDDTLTFTVADASRNYLNISDSIAYTIEGSGEESPFELLFSMPGECQFNGNANVSGETCKDGDGNPLTDKKYIDTNVALFSEENAGRDFEIYFTLTDYATTQINQGTIFNAKYEDSSVYYPGFTIRTVGTNGNTLEITGRLGKDNSDNDKSTIRFGTANIVNKEFKIVRVNGQVSYSVDGGAMTPFQNYHDFDRFFEQTAIFGASRTPSNGLQRYYNGTIKNIRVLFKKKEKGSIGIAFDANGGTGTMPAVTAESVEVGTEITLPKNLFTREGYIFAGWNTEADGTGVAYADEAVITVAEFGEIELFAQWIENKAVLDSGSVVNSKIKKLANGGSGSYNTSSNDTNIKAIREASSLPAGFNTSNSNNIVSAAAPISPIPIYAWFDNGDYNEDGLGDGIIYLYTDADTIYGGEDCSQMFRKIRSLADISALGSWDISSATSMRLMFFESLSLANISALASWNTSNVTDMYGVFGEDASLADISALASWDTSNVTDMGSMFTMFGSNNSSPLVDISALATWNTSSVTSMYNMFAFTSITNVDALETKQYEGRDYVSWDTSNVTDMSSMFFGTTSLADISALATWNTSSVTNMASMFSGAGITNVDALETKQYEGRDYVSWDTSSVTNMGNMFNGNRRILTDISALASWNTSNVTYMTSMFSGAGITNVDALETKQYEGRDYVSWDTSSVTNMSWMFSGATYLKDISALATWNTSNVTNMASMFGSTYITNISALETKQYEGRDYVSWDTSNVTDMSGLFGENTSLADISALATWNTSSVTNMKSMFRRNKSLANISALATWNTSSVTNMESMFYMTSITNVGALETKRHEGKDYVSWNTSSVTSMSSMFTSTTSLEDISALATWNTSSVTNMESMFSNAIRLADVSALDSWNTSSVTNMDDMFYNIAATQLPTWYH